MYIYICIYIYMYIYIYVYTYIYIHILLSHTSTVRKDRTRKNTEYHLFTIITSQRDSSYSFISSSFLSLLSDSIIQFLFFLLFKYSLYSLSLIVITTFVFSTPPSLLTVTDSEESVVVPEPVGDGPTLTHSRE